MEEFYTVAQAAKILKVHQITLRRYIKEGKLKAYRAAGNVRISPADLKDFAQSFVPKVKPPKETSESNEANFFLNDPIFRLKARGLSIDRGRNKD